MSHRIKELLQVMKTLRLDSAVILNDGSLRNYGYYTYFTGVYEPRRAMLTIGSDGVLRTWVALDTTTDTGSLAKYPRGIEVTPVTNLLSCLDNLLRNTDHERFGILGCDAIERLLDGSVQVDPWLGFGDHSELKERVLSMKRQKTVDDLRHLQHGYTLASSGMSMYAALVRELGPNLASQAHVQEWLRSQGAEPMIIQVGDEIIGGRHDETGDGTISDAAAFVLIELATPTGHWVELGRTLLLPHATPGQRTKVEHLQSAFEELIRMIELGMPCAEIAGFAERIAHNLGAWIEGRIGHGTGVDEDLPQIQPGSIDTIENGDVFCIHLIFRDNAEGFLYGVADTFQMTEGGAVGLGMIGSIVQ